MSIVLDGTSGITTPAETVQGALTTTGNTILGDASTDTLNVGNGGLVKDASGNVGIGTASPTVASGLGVVLNGGASQTRLAFKNTYTGDASGDGVQFVLLSASSELLFQNRESDGSFAWEINGTEQMRITAAGLLKFNSGYGSAATAYGCRAWVNFNGTGTVAIRASGNVSSITDNGTGDYTVNFTTAMPDANYATFTGNQPNSADTVNTSNVYTATGGIYTTSAVRVWVGVGQTGTARDPFSMYVAIFR